MTVLHCVDKDGIAVEVRPGEACAGFRELGRYDFACAPDYQLFVDDVALPVVVGQDGVRSWRWVPGYFAGEVAAELVHSTSKQSVRYRLDVAPDARKLGRETFDGMVGDLFAFNPRLLSGTESAQFSIGVTGSLSNPHLAYARLRRYGDQLVAAMEEVACKPLTRLRHERQLVRYHEAKKLDRRSLLKASRNPSAIALLHPTETAGQPHDVRFDVSKSFEDFDNPANRLVTASLLAVMRRTRQVSAALLASVNDEEESSTRTPTSMRVPRRVDYLNKLFASLRRLQRKNPYSECSRHEVSAAGLNAISAHPAYARAYRYAWCALRSGIEGRRGAESLWISPTWEIYERWCFLQMHYSLKRIFPNTQWEPRYPSKYRHDCIRVRGVTPLGEIGLWSQARFPAWDVSKRRGFYSISRERFPDVVMTMKNGSHQRFWIFDAKYRVSRAGVLDGMQSAHLYRDSLRWKDAAPQSALLLVPGGDQGGWLEDSVFRDANGVGIVRLGPESDKNALDTFLQQLIGA